jgi:hypothetical protein
MSKECKTEVERVMNEKAKDYRLNYRLTHACEQDIPRLCDNVCSTIPGQICGGLVLQCLQVGCVGCVCLAKRCACACSLAWHSHEDFYQGQGFQVCR